MTLDRISRRPAWNLSATELSKAPSFDTENRGNGHYLLKVRGSFPPGWLVKLSAGLSDHGVSILRGKGKQIQSSYWTAEFEIDMPMSAGDPRDLDFAAFIARGLPNKSDEQLELREFNISPPEPVMKAVWVEVRGADKIGFLRNILNAFAFYSLFPCQIEVETRMGSAHDRFLLRGIAGMAPSSNALQGVQELLGECLVGA